MIERLSASNAGRIMMCPGSANLELAIPGYVPPVVDPTKGAKGKGTDIHKAFEMTQGLTATDLRHFIDALEYYYGIRSKRRFKELSEYTFTLDFLQRQPRTTVDRVLYLSDELHVFDWKTGKIPVDPYDNEQLLTYALAAAQEFAPLAKGVWVHVVQPWADVMAAVWVTADELAQHMLNLIEAEKKILAHDVTLHPSKHCTFCPANPHSRGDKGHPLCPAQMALLYPDVELDEDEILKG